MPQTVRPNVPTSSSFTKSASRDISIERWADWLEGLTFTHESDGTTTLTGPLADQAALHGVLNRIRDLALPIVSVRRVRPAAERAIQ